MDKSKMFSSPASRSFNPDAPSNHGIPYDVDEIGLLDETEAPAEDTSSQEHVAPSGVGFFDNLRDAQDKASEQQVNTNTLVAMLAGARSLGPLLDAVAVTPGANASQSELQDSMAELIGASNQITEHVMGLLDVENNEQNAWIKSMIMQTAVSGVAESWKQRGEVNANAWLDVVGRVFDAGIMDVKRGYPDVDDETAYFTSHFTAMTALSAEIQKFSFFLDKAQVLEMLSKHLANEVSEGTDLALEGVNASSKDRLMVEQGLTQHGGRLLATVYRDEATKTLQHMLVLNKEQKNDYIKRGQHRASLNNICSSFSFMYNALVEATKSRAAELTTDKSATMSP